MLTQRIIPCLDVMNGQVVKGVNFVDLVNEGDPVEMAARYSNSGADELVFLDIRATLDSRPVILNMIQNVAKEVFIPFTVGGGVNSTKDIGLILEAGADKVSINSGAIANPSLLEEAATQFGSQCIVLAMDVKKDQDQWNVYSHGGKKKTSLEAISWAARCIDLGIGEILLTSMDADGTQKGVDLEITRQISQSVNVPVIASGGIGQPEHFLDAIRIGKADAVLAASVFHRNIFSINRIKLYLQEHGISVRLTGENDEY